MQPMRRPCCWEGLGPFYTRWIIPVLDEALRHKGELSVYRWWRLPPEN